MSNACIGPNFRPCCKPKRQLSPSYPKTARSSKLRSNDNVLKSRRRDGSGLWGLHRVVLCSQTSGWRAARSTARQAGAEVRQQNRNKSSLPCTRCHIELHQNIIAETSRAFGGAGRPCWVTVSAQQSRVGGQCRRWQLIAPLKAPNSQFSTTRRPKRTKPPPRVLPISIAGPMGCGSRAFG